MFAGQIPLLPVRMLLPYLVMLKPSHPVRWVGYVRDAYRNGRETASLVCGDYEALLPMPLAAARRALGVRPLEEVHRRGIPEKGWLLDRLERNVTLV